MNMTIEEQLRHLRYHRGYLAGLRGRAPSESWDSYLEGYYQGKEDSKPGARWKYNGRIPYQED